MTQVKWYGPQVKASIRKAAAKGLFEGAEHVLEEANREVPIAPDGGTLMRSGETAIDEQKLRAAVSYNTPYAVRQHEELTWKHSDPTRKAKYLEDPLNGPPGKRAFEHVRDAIRKTTGA